MEINQETAVELLKACKRALWYIDTLVEENGLPDTFGHKTRPMLRAAIARAEGKESK
jgi:hypothetical protein